MTTIRKARSSTRSQITDGRQSVIEKVESDPHGALELAAAIVEQRAEQLLFLACSARPEVTNRSLAELLHVTEGRVSQVLSGSEAPRLNTLARYMRAMGYHVEISAVPVDSSIPPLEAESASSYWAKDHTIYVSAVTDGNHRGKAIAIIPSFVRESANPQWEALETLESVSVPWSASTFVNVGKSGEHRSG